MFQGNIFVILLISSKINIFLTFSHKNYLNLSIQSMGKLFCKRSCGSLAVTNEIFHFLQGPDNQNRVGPKVAG